MKRLENIHLILFDWGNTIMVDYPDEVGPMYQWKKVALVDGMEEILPYLFQKKYTLAIATNANLSNAKDVVKALKRVNIHTYFTYIFTSRDVGYKKPDPLFFDSILKMVCIEPSECVMIGDNYEKDIVGAHVLGLHTILLTTQNNLDQFPKAECIISDIRQLKNIL